MVVSSDIWHFICHWVQSGISYYSKTDDLPAGLWTNSPMSVPPSCSTSFFFSGPSSLNAGMSSIRSGLSPSRARNLLVSSMDKDWLDFELTGGAGLSPLDIAGGGGVDGREILGGGGTTTTSSEIKRSNFLQYLFWHPTCNPNYIISPEYDLDWNTYIYKTVFCFHIELTCHNT